ncbi:MAG: hypothetical protein GF398_00390 [Chitinivibrionales bacterium]|nr:hypothetical protein [Chitinivibrionales bacterium]
MIPANTTTLTVTGIEFISPSLFIISFKRGRMKFTSGDCISLYNAEGESRPYSICSGMKDKELSCYIRSFPAGLVTSYLAARKPGDKVVTSYPFGWFRPGQCGEKTDRHVFIATGTGIAPFLSYMRSFPARPPDACIYGVRTLADAQPAIAGMAGKTAFTLAISRERVGGYCCGRITATLDSIPLKVKMQYYLCGLDSMIDEVSLWLEHQGVDLTNIHQEVFFNADT